MKANVYDPHLRNFHRTLRKNLSSIVRKIDIFDPKATRFFRIRVYVFKIRNAVQEKEAECRPRAGRERPQCQEKTENNYCK